MFLGIDIGGTKTLLALFSSRGLCLKKLKFPTASSPSLFLSTLQNNLDTILPPEKRTRLESVTVAVPGTIKIEQKNFLISCENLNWHNIDIYTSIKKLFSCKIFFINDANSATLYEASRLKTQDKIIYLTFSTGIGGGIFKNNYLSDSSDNFEPGHKKYLFQNRSLEWEDIASAQTLSKLYNSPLSNLKLTAKIKDDIVSRISLGIIDIIKAESPQIVIIGGPLALIYHDLKKPLLSLLQSSPEIHPPLPRIIPAHRPTESAIYGTYLYSKQH